MESIVLISISPGNGRTQEPACKLVRPPVFGKWSGYTVFSLWSRCSFRAQWPRRVLGCSCSETDSRPVLESLSQLKPSSDCERASRVGKRAITRRHVPRHSTTRKLPLKNIAGKQIESKSARQALLRPYAGSMQTRWDSIWRRAPVHHVPLARALTHGHTSNTSNEPDSPAALLDLTQLTELTWLTRVRARNRAGVLDHCPLSPWSPAMQTIQPGIQTLTATGMTSLPSPGFRHSIAGTTVKNVYGLRSQLRLRSKVPITTLSVSFWRKQVFFCL